MCRLTTAPWLALALQPTAFCRWLGERLGLDVRLPDEWEQCVGTAVGGAGAKRGARVIRGGSWRVNRGFARADFRLDAMPGDRVGSTEFRIAYSVRGATDGECAAFAVSDRRGGQRPIKHPLW